jgi:FAD/FMN-containing dehydrogenase
MAVNQSHNMTIDPKKSGVSPSAPTWGNWSGNIVHEPPTNGANYYFRPTNLVELKSVLADAVKAGVTVRVSGKRHSQPPLVTNDNRGAVPPLPTTYLLDMSCYADLGPDGKDLMVLGPGPNQVTVNPGVREDDLDAFLTQNNLMLETVTAGGFFSIGGMTAVDVHGGTVDAPISAETASAFTILGADGNETIINEQSKDGDGHSLLAFARVSLGALGIVTRITLNARPRPYANKCEHAPWGDGVVPDHTAFPARRKGEKGEIRCSVQRTVDETYPAGVFFHALRREVAGHVQRSCAVVGC